MTGEELVTADGLAQSLQEVAGWGGGSVTATVLFKGSTTGVATLSDYVENYDAILLMAANPQYQGTGISIEPSLGYVFVPFPSGTISLTVSGNHANGYNSGGISIRKVVGIKF